jgi:hypothetical protein
MVFLAGSFQRNARGRFFVKGKINESDFRGTISLALVAAWSCLLNIIRCRPAKAKWNKLAYSHRRQFARWINDAKQEETRQRRADKAVDMLLTGKTVN